MLQSLPDAALSSLLDALAHDEGGAAAAAWARLACVSRGLRQQVLVAAGSKRHSLSLDTDGRGRRRALQALSFAGRWCPQVVALRVAGRLPQLEDLLPCLTGCLDSLSIHGACLATGTPCSTSQLAALLRRSCPKLRVLRLQDCSPVDLAALAPLFCAAPGDQPPQRHQQGEQPAQQLLAVDLRGSLLQRGGAASPGPRQRAAGATLRALLLGPGTGGVPGKGWVGSRDAVGDAELLALLRAAGCEELSELDVGRRRCVTDEALRHLALHAPRLRVLDVSLTSVTPAAVVALAEACGGLSVLRYAARDPRCSLELGSVQRLAACGQRLEELDLSLHSGLDDACLAALAACEELRQFTLSRSHKVTADGLRALLQAGHVRRLLLVRCKGVGAAALKQLAAGHPGVSIDTER